MPAFIILSTEVGSRHSALSGLGVFGRSCMNSTNSFLKKSTVSRDSPQQFMDTTVSPGRNTQFPFSSSYSALSPSLRIFSRSTIEVNIPFPSTQQTPREEVPLSVSVFFTLKPIAQQ